MNRANNLAYRIRTGRHRAFQPGGAFETTARSADDGTAYVYARYIGTDDPLNGRTTEQSAAV
ncbi:hypothetical protein [Streptomyces yunnanensis]|nr:hypothetical protein [Streptomyces yunnanensis]